MVWKEIAEPVSPFLASVREFLEAQVATFEDEVAEGARYALSAGGKQLRPVLVALSARAVGELNSQHVSAAAIVELVHIATLVHDDVIDAASTRRQRPTVASQFGNQTAVLLGDALFAHALKLAAGFPTTEVCRIVAGATKAVCSGEILQTLGRGRLDQPLENYFRIIELKTAELFALSCELGALLASASPACRAALRRFGMRFGTAYQLFDDCLDVFGDERLAGKTLGTDLANGKPTLPLLLAHQHASAAERRLLEGMIDSPDREAAAGARPVLARTEAAARCREFVESHLEGAREALEPLNGSGETSGLRDLTRYLGAQCSRLALPLNHHPAS